MKVLLKMDGFYNTCLKFKWTKGRDFMYMLYFGLFFIALVLGFLTGISNTPVVGIILPLVFSLISAGGGIYIVIKKNENFSPDELRSKASLIGAQLIFFSVGFLPGVWLGVGGKIHYDKIWFSGNSYLPVYQDFQYKNVLLLRAIMELDSKLYESNISYDKRKEILGEMVSSISSRIDEDGDLSYNDKSALSELISSPKDDSLEEYGPVAKQPGLSSWQESGS